MSERFIVQGCSGYSEYAMSARRLSTSYSVLDTAYLYREVARFYVQKGGSETEAKRLARAEAECARLNEWARTA